MLAQRFQRGFAFQQHRDAVDGTTSLFLADIHETARDIVCVCVAQQLLCQIHAHTTRTDDGDLDLLYRLRHFMSQFLTCKDLQQKTQEFSLPGVLFSAFEGVAVDHTHCQRSQQIHAGQRQQACKADSLHPKRVCQTPLHHQLSHERCSVSHQQSDIALDPAVAPDLLIDFAQIPCCKYTHRRNDAVQHNALQTQCLCGDIEQHHQQVQRQHNGEVVDDQRPPV